MPGYCVIAEKPEVVAQLVGFAKAGGARSTVLVLGGDPVPFTQTGADRVVAFAGAGPLMETYARAAAQFVSDEGADLLLVGSSVRGRDVAARVAGYLDCGMVSDAARIAVEGGAVRTERSVYGGTVVRTEETACPCVVTVPAGLFDSVRGTTPAPEVVAVAADERVVLQASEPLERGAVNLAKAEKVVCVGLGFKEQGDLQIAQRLADGLRADIACTRSIAEGRKWLPVEQYIGISGVTIKPRLYLSIGVSGQVQHVYGIREAGLIVAIDSDAGAPIFGAADYGVVGDLYEVVPLLADAIEADR